MFSGVLDTADHNVKLIKHIIMKKYYFAFFCALMAATCAMAAPQSGDRIVAAQALTVEWNDAAFRPTMDGASFDMGLKAQLNPSDNENVLILSGLCDMFDIPVHVDYTTGKAWIETGMPLDAYTDQFKRDVVRTIYALPEQWLVDAEADMNTNLYGSILEDGSIAFDGGVVFLVRESMAEQDLAAAADASETVWMTSPLFRNMRLLVPNAVHQFTLVNDPVNFEAVATTESTSSSDQGYLSRVNHSDMCKIDRNKMVINSGKRPPRNDPGGATTCGVVGDLVVASQSAPSGGGVIMFHPIHPTGDEGLSGKKVIVYNPNNPHAKFAVSGNEVAFVNPNSEGGVIACHPDLPLPLGDLVVVQAGKKGIVKNPNAPLGCGGIPGGGNVVVATKDTPGGGGVIAAPSVIPFNPGDMGHPFEFTDSVGRKPVKPREVKPCGGGGGIIDNEVATRRPIGGGDVRSCRTNGNDNPSDAFDLTAGKKVDPKNPYTPKPCSDPGIWRITLESLNAQLPTRFGPNPNVASSKQADEQFSVPVYVFQNPDDNTITVYNLYGSGYVMDLSDCQVTPESITWGTTIPYIQDGDISFYFDSNVLTLTDGAQFTVAAAIVKGDLSNDGKVNIADVTELIDFLLTAGNDKANQAVADVNEDGKINITDTTILIDMLLHNAQ